MEPSFKAKAAFVVLSVAVSGFCIYCMVEPLVRKSNDLMRKQLESPCPGPFDDAFARTLGETDYQDLKIKMEPPNFSEFSAVDWDDE